MIGSVFIIVVFLAGFPIGSNAGNCCYFLTTYEKNQIIDNSTVRPTNYSNEWKLSTNISWPLPDTSNVPYTIDSYAIDVEELINREKQLQANAEGSCSYCFINNDTDIITRSRWHVFDNLKFGTEYVFYIHLIRTNSIHKGIFNYKHVFETPDCFLKTKDGDFCKKQDVQISGMIIDIRVDDIVPQSKELVMVTLSWIPPVHVQDGNTLVAYNIKCHALLEGTTTINTIQTQNQTNWRKRQVAVVPDLSMNETYQLEIEPVVKRTLSTVEQTGRSFKVTFDTFIYVDDCSCDGLTTYTRICQSLEDCNGTIVGNTTCQIGKECRESTDFTSYAIGAGVLLLITVVLLSFVIKIYCCNRSGKSDANMEQDYLFVDPVFQNYEIASQTDVMWDERKPIGNGRFGMVYSCPLKQENGLHIVAIKTPLDTASAAEKMDFKKEIQLMAQIGKHINIIELIGCRTAKDPMYIITPLMQYGCLLELLRKSATMQQKGVFTDEIYDLRLKDLFSISRQIAKGMEYISSLRIVHGDLAARNVLIGKGLLVKIGDFGLGQDTYEKGYLRLKDGEVPVKWYSLETLLEHYMTPMSDVWSFGILLYEIFTFGKSPYPGIIIGTLPQLLQRGYRMHRPEHCPSTAYKIMTSCWHEHPKKRPTFKMLYHQFDTVLEFVTNDSNLYLKLSEEGKNEEEDTMPEIMKNKKSEIDNYELRILESRQKYSISEETYDEEESTGQTCNVVEYTPFMETSSQFGGKSCGVDSQLPHYDFTSEGTKFNSMEDVTFIPIFEDSGNSEVF